VELRQIGGIGAPLTVLCAIAYHQPIDRAGLADIFGKDRRTAYRWAANPAVQIGSHISPRACGNKHTKESVLKLSGARTKQTNCFSATLPTFSARRNVRYSLQNSEVVDQTGALGAKMTAY